MTHTALKTLVSGKNVHKIYIRSEHAFNVSAGCSTLVPPSLTRRQLCSFLLRRVIHGDALLRGLPPLEGGRALLPSGASSMMATTASPVGSAGNTLLRVCSDDARMSSGSIKHLLLFHVSDKH